MLRQVDSPYVKTVWDVCHPYRLGEGEALGREILDLLASRGYNGFVCAEWEKRWRPEIEGPGIALQDNRLPRLTTAKRRRRSPRAPRWERTAGIA